MRKKTILTLLLLFNFLLIQNTSGQKQLNMPEYLRQKFARYTEAIPREEIFVHTDREEYIAGENLWFSVYLIDRKSSKPSLNSRIAYFELLNAENRPVVQKRILIDKGSGPGQFILPDTLSSGIYTIRAYTSWMKNFLPDNCFMKDIIVYNSFSTKAFKGKKTSVKKPVKFNYSKNSDQIKTADVNLYINNSLSGILEIIVIADGKFRFENNNLIYIFIQARGNIKQVSTEMMTGDTTRIAVSKAKLGEGINQITVFNSKGEPVADRLFYIPVKENALLTINSVDSCNRRNNVTLDMEPENGKTPDWNSSGFSISVSPLKREMEIMTMSEYLIFGSEYGKQLIDEMRERKIEELPAEAMDSILLFAKSNWIKWDEILSENLPHFKYPFEKEEHFIFGKLFTNDQQTANAGEFILMCNPGKQAGFQYAKTDKEGNFRFGIHIDEEQKDLIIMPDNIDNNKRIVIEPSFSDQFLPSEIMVDSTKGSFPPYISKFSVNHQVNRIFEVPAYGKSSNSIFPPVKPIRFYGKPDIELIMSDYISLPLMEEVFFELLPHVSLKKKNSGYEIIITDRIDDKPYITIPYLLIDGVIIKDPSLIINLDPELVEKIDVIKENYVVGKFVFPGIVNVITKTGNFNSIPLPDYMIRMLYNVTDPVWSFAWPDYSVSEIKNSRIPDYRNTLYWNPLVKTNKDGKARIEFSGSDNISDYMINIQGITTDGQPFSIRKIIKVK